MTSRHISPVDMRQRPKLSGVQSTGVRLDASLMPGRGDIGPLTIGLLVSAYTVLWLVARPSGEPLTRHLGQGFGAASVLLMSIALVLISTLPWVEGWFNGIDRAAIWHRRAAIGGVLLLVPHIVLASSPDSSAFGGQLAVIGMIGLVVLATWSVLPRWRDLVPASLQRPVLALRETALMRGLRWLLGGYERWRGLHRTTGVFVAAGFVHGIMDATAFDDAPILRWSYVAVGGLGLAFYVYRELVARFFLPLHDYQVAAVKAIDESLVEITLAPIGRPLAFVPGQFAMVYLEAKDGWHRHPFTVTSAPHEGLIRVTVKALGDYTSQLGNILKPGMPAIIGGPHGRFDWRTGTERQVWIGAGVGVAPFLSWLRSLDADFDLNVDFFYTTDGKAPFADEILAIGQRHPSLRMHLIDTSTEGRLTPERVLATTGTPPRELSVYMCGPNAMLQHFGSALRRAGVPRGQIHREYFNWR